MMHRNLGQRSLAEAWLPERSGANRRLEAVNEVVNRTGVERSLADIHAARTGRPSYPPLLICQEYSEQLRSPLAPQETFEKLMIPLSPPCGGRCHGVTEGGPPPATR